MTAGSTLWLMAHELRLLWRLGEEKGRWVKLGLIGFLLVIMSGAGFPFGLMLRGQGPALTPVAIIAAATAFAFIAVMAFATSLSFTAASFVDRADIDLLLSSPLPMRRLLTVRLTATALRSVVLWLLLFGPPFITIACIAGPRWLCGLLLILIAGMTGTSLSSWLVIALFRALGAKQVKTITTVITALSGLSMGLFSALFNARLGNHRPGSLFDHTANLPLFAPDAIGSLPARVLFGGLGATLLLGVAAVALFLVTLWLLAPAFAKISIQGDPQRLRSAGNAPLTGFGGNLFRRILIKEYRLLLRNHALMLQILARSIAFIPLLAINLSHDGNLDLPKLAGGVTLILSQAGGALVWAFIAAETLPDLLGSSPHPAALFRKSRLTAGLLPALSLVLLSAALLTPRSHLAGLSVLIMGTAACLCSAAINSLAKAVPGRRGVPRASLPAQVADMASGAAWAAAAWLLAKGSIWTPLPVWLGLSAVWLWREFSRRDL